MLTPQFPLRTERLLLRPYTMGDLEFFADLQSRPDVTRYLYLDVMDRQAAREALSRKVTRTGLARAGDALTLLMIDGDGRPVGDVMLMWVSEEHRSGEIGYTVHPGHAGNGYATEGSRLMLRLGFEELGLHRVVGRLDARNAASARVLERLGMRREAHFRQNEWVKGEWTDEAVYALLDEEWRKARG